MSAEKKLVCVATLFTVVVILMVDNHLWRNLPAAFRAKLRVNDFQSGTNLGVGRATTNSTPSPASSTAAVSNSSYINPGCIKRKLTWYLPVDTRTTYFHPPIVHYAKLSRSGFVTLSFTDYMAVMSAYKFLLPQKILVHTYGNITGKYWDLTQSWTGTSVEMNKVNRVTSFGGKRPSYIAHEADYIRLQNLLKYGGVISDFDVIVVNGTKLKEEQRMSECVLSREGEFVNIGFNSCIKNSSYIQMFIDSYQTDYNPRSWVYNSGIKPTMILEDKNERCFNFYLDGTICLNPNAGRNKIKWLRPNGVDWRSKTAAHHFTKMGPDMNNEGLLKMNHSFGEMLNYVNDFKV